jgi:hypothetical protein
MRLQEINHGTPFGNSDPSVAVGFYIMVLRLLGLLADLTLIAKEERNRKAVANIDSMLYVGLWSKKPF